MNILDFIAKTKELQNHTSTEYWKFRVDRHDDCYVIYWRNKPLHIVTKAQLAIAILTAYNMYHLEYVRDYTAPEEYLDGNKL